MASIRIACFQCGKEFSKRISEYNRSEEEGKHHFCSLQCAAKFKNVCCPAPRIEDDEHQKKRVRKKFWNSEGYSLAKRKRNCEKCNSKDRVEAHHPDYSKPLEVIWLCRKCHNSV